VNAPLLVELLCEELPPKALGRLGAAFAAGIVSGLKARKLVSEDAAYEVFATPRRLGVLIATVAAKAADEAVETKLVPASVGIGADGSMTEALKKRLIPFGDPVELFTRVSQRADGKQEMLFLKRMASGQVLERALTEALEESIEKLPIPKLMSYQLEDGRTTVKFVRPAHGLVALHGTGVVALHDILGLSSGRETRGHRFQGAKIIKLTRADDYERALKEEGSVIASFAKRREAILEQLQAAGKGLGSLGAADGYEALLDEVTALVEKPTVYVGTFDAEFLAVPAECLVLTMRQNQKYFPLFDAAGALTNKFLIVSNMEPADPVNIVQGNERVVRPRLADARFFFDTDRKTRLRDRIQALDSIVYHAKLGTQGERVKRLSRLAGEIQKGLPRGEKGVDYAKTAALLAKADLTTLMVGEFPELQGTMGRYYAQADGEEPSVVRAIEQHYWPRFAGDQLPTGDASIAVALADRLLSLVGMFSIGQVPTGDKDPFGLRRAALGMVRILMDSKPALEMDLHRLITTTADVLEVSVESKDQLVGSVNEFVRERFANLMKERGYSANEVASVMAAQGVASLPDRLDLMPSRLDAIREFLKLPESGSLIAANKRLSNILRQATQKGEPFAMAHEPFGEKLDQDLIRALEAASAKASPLFEKRDYTGYLKSFAVLKEPVDAFFEGVMVMAEDVGLRCQRLSLLNRMQYEMNRVADLARLAA